MFAMFGLGYWELLIVAVICAMIAGVVGAVVLVVALATRQRDRRR